VSKRLLIQINGEPREVKEDISLAELITSLRLKPEQVAIELNQEVIRRTHWEATILAEADKVEIVHFVGGGETVAGGSRQTAVGSL
jgi:thiamine biosynthesis protein ThiS